MSNKIITYRAEHRRLLDPLILICFTCITSYLNSYILENIEYVKYAHTDIRVALVTRNYHRP